MQSNTVFGFAVVSTGRTQVPDTGGEVLRFVYPQASLQAAKRSLARMLIGGASSTTKTIVPMSEIVPSKSTIVLDRRLNGHAPR